MSFLVTSQYEAELFHWTKICQAQLPYGIFFANTAKITT